MAEEDQDDLWDDLFGGSDSAGTPGATPSGTPKIGLPLANGTGSSSTPVHSLPPKIEEQKEKKDKKDKNDKVKKEDKEKKDKKDKKDKKEKADKGKADEKADAKEKGGKAKKKGTEAEEDGSKKRKRSVDRQKFDASWQASAPGAQGAAAPLLPEKEAGSPAKKRLKKSKGAEDAGSGGMASGEAGAEKAKKEKKDKKDKKDKKEGKAKKEGKDKKDKKEKKEKKDKKAKGQTPDASPGQTSEPHFSLSPFMEQFSSPGGQFSASASMAGTPRSAVAGPTPVAGTPGAEDIGDVMKVFEEEDVFGNMFEDDKEKDREDEEAVKKDEAKGEEEIALFGAEDEPKELPLWKGKIIEKRPRKSREDFEEFVTEPEEFSLNEKFGEVMDNLKQKKPVNIQEKDAITFVMNLVEEMEAAAVKDEEDFKQAKPMLRKIQLLDKVENFITKSQFASHFVANGGCHVLGWWLKITPDGKLPSLELRSKILKMLVRLPITKEALQNCTEHSLGAAVRACQKHPMETAVNRKVANELIQKWLSHILLKKTSGGDDEEEDAVAPEQVLAAPPRRAVETAEDVARLEAESALRRHPAPPRKESAFYAVMPLSKDQAVPRPKIDPMTHEGKLKKAMQELARPNKKPYKPFSMSIAGREVNIEHCFGGIMQGS